MADIIIQKSNEVKKPWHIKQHIINTVTYGKEITVPR